MSEEQLERDAKISKAAQEIMSKLLNGHGPEQAIAIIGTVIAGLAEVARQMDEGQTKLSSDEIREHFIKAITIRARNTETHVVRIQQ